MLTKYESPDPMLPPAFVSPALPKPFIRWSSSIIVVALSSALQLPLDGDYRESKRLDGCSLLTWHRYALCSLERLHFPDSHVLKQRLISIASGNARYRMIFTI
jgi:hypothetical protein